MTATTRASIVQYEQGPAGTVTTCGGDFDAAARNYLSNVIVELTAI